MSIGCCGRPDIQGLAYAADQYPRSTRAGQRARARLALALVELRASAVGDLDLARRARRSLGALGTTTSLRDRAVQTSIATLRDARSTPAATTFWERRASRIGTQVDQVLAIVNGALGVVEGVVQAAAASEAAAALRDGREPNYTTRDVGKTLAWFRWFFGGPLPTDVAESDVRLLGTVFAVAAPLLTVGLAALRATAGTNTSLRDALSAFDTYLAGITRSVQNAVAALPPPAAGAPPEPPPSPPPEMLTEMQRFAAMTPMQRMAFIQQSKALFRVRASDIVAPKTGNPLLVALPAAALVWYFIR
jgi:hypothetical protein